MSRCRCEGCWWPMRLVSRLPEPLYRLVSGVLERNSQADFESRGEQVEQEAAGRVTPDYARLRLGSCCYNVGTDECACETPTNWGTPHFDFEEPAEPLREVRGRRVTEDDTDW